MHITHLQIRRSSDIECVETMTLCFFQLIALGLCFITFRNFNVRDYQEKSQLQAAYISNEKSKNETSTVVQLHLDNEPS